jgi:putative nucleotidyltransferase with HDIG domain
MDALTQGGSCVASVRRVRHSEDTRTFGKSVGNRISAEAGHRLLTHIEQRRREVVASALRASSFEHSSGTIASSVFTNTFLDQLTLEIDTDDRESLDAWSDAASDAGAASERPRLIILACAALSASYAREHELCGEVFPYLAMRGSELAQRMEKATAARKHGVHVDPSKLVHKEEIVTSLLVTLEARDPETAEHSRAVGAWCRRIASAMGMAAEQQEFAELCGTLHDVGKVSTPREIIAKPGPLNEDEWADMHAHSRVGAKLLERIPSLKDVAPIVRSHHERFDGKGYPDRLCGAEIPVMARIVAVADAFHAMASRHSYREALSLSRAVEVLAAGRGTQWDPTVVDVVLNLIHRKAHANDVRRVI